MSSVIPANRSLLDSNFMYVNQTSQLQNKLNTTLVEYQTYDTVEIPLSKQICTPFDKEDSLFPSFIQISLLRGTLGGSPHELVKAKALTFKQVTWLVARQFR